MECDWNLEIFPLLLKHLRVTLVDEPSLDPLAEQLDPNL